MTNNGIKIGQNVIHLVNTQYPHLSSSKMRPFYNKAYGKYLHKEKGYDDVFINSLNDWYMKFMGKLKQARISRKMQSIFYEQNDALGLLSQLKNDKMGNCGEDAQFAELILRINGIKNACTASLKRGCTGIKHDVCLFNIDDSVVEGNIKNNITVVVDPWLGKTDYINNYFAQNICLLEDYVKIPSEGKFGLNIFGRLNIPGNFLQRCNNKYPELLLKFKKNK